MKVIDTEITVGPNGTAVIAAKLPADMAEGTHRAVLVLEDGPQPQRPKAGRLVNPEGLWASQGTDVSAADIAAAREEMWGKFDRGTGA